MGFCFNSVNAQIYTPGAGVTDIDGNFYETIIIGSQEWMKENLNTHHYSNGDSISYVSDGNDWANVSVGAFVWYNNDVNNASAYGSLYNGYSVLDSRGLCPEGWHIPSNAEWIQLANVLGGESVAGDKMKVDGTAYWSSSNSGTNESGFTGLPAGARAGSLLNGMFGDLGSRANFWTSETSGLPLMVVRRLVQNSAELLYANAIDATPSIDPTIGYSCRCINDEAISDVGNPENRLNNTVAYPNPTTGNIRLDLGQTAENITLNVLNVHGALIHTEELNNVQTHQLTLPEISGIYFIQLMDAEGRIETQKVVRE